MKSLNVLKPALVCFAVMTFLCGILYTTAVTGIAQLIFKEQANGSIIKVILDDGKEMEYGSALIAQDFTKPEYLHGRPLGVTNLSPVSEELKVLVQDRIDLVHSIDPDNRAEIPLDLVTASGSGVDPNISPEAAKYQIARIAKERNMKEELIEEIIEENTTGRFLGFWGEPAVNVLKVNLALDGLQ